MSKKVAKKISKVLLILGCIAIIAGLAIYFIGKENKFNKLDWFFMLEIKTNNRIVTIEPKKLTAKYGDNEIVLTEKQMNDFNNYFNSYFSNIKEKKANENKSYIWTVRLQDKQLDNYYLGSNEYPNNWNEFLLKVDAFLNETYLSKKIALKEEDDLSLQTISSINFEDTCTAYNCTYSVKTASRTLLLQYIRTSDGEGGFNNQKLLLNNKELISDDFMCGGPTKLQTLGDNIIIMYHYGCDTEGDILSGYDYTGKQLFKYNNLDENNPSMYITGTTFDIKGDTITINATRDAGGKEIYVDDTTTISYCDADQLSNYQITDSDIYTATYGITYKNEIFELPTIITSQTITEANILNNCVEVIE